MTGATAVRTVEVVLDGELDIATADEAQRRVAAAERAAPSLLVIDLCRLTFVDSSGVRLVAPRRRPRPRCRQTAGGPPRHGARAARLQRTRPRRQVRRAPGAATTRRPTRPQADGRRAGRSDAALDLPSVPHSVPAARRVVDAAPHRVGGGGLPRRRGAAGQRAGHERRPARGGRGRDDRGGARSRERRCTWRSSTAPPRRRPPDPARRRAATACGWSRPWPTAGAARSTPAASACGSSSAGRPSGSADSADAAAQLHVPVDVLVEQVAEPSRDRRRSRPAGRRPAAT